MGFEKQITQEQTRIDEMKVLEDGEPMEEGEREELVEGYTGQIDSLMSDIGSLPEKRQDELKQSLLKLLKSIDGANIVDVQQDFDSALESWIGEAQSAGSSADATSDAERMIAELKLEKTKPARDRAREKYRTAQAEYIRLKAEVDAITEEDGPYDLAKNDFISKRAVHRTMVKSLVKKYGSDYEDDFNDIEEEQLVGFTSERDAAQKIFTPMHESLKALRVQRDKSQQQAADATFDYTEAGGEEFDLVVINRELSEEGEV